MPHPPPIPLPPLHPSSPPEPASNRLPVPLPPRSFTFIDDCVEGILRLTKSDFVDPVNIGSDEMVSMNEMMAMAIAFEGKPLPIKHIPVRR